MALPVGVVQLGPEGATFRVRVTPRGGREQVGPVIGGVLRIKVTALPVEGQANEAVVALLARSLDVPKWAIQIIRGAGSRDKTIRVLGATLPGLEKLFSMRT